MSWEFGTDSISGVIIAGVFSRGLKKHRWQYNPAQVRISSTPYLRLSSSLSHLASNRNDQEHLQPSLFSPPASPPLPRLPLHPTLRPLFKLLSSTKSQRNRKCISKNRRGLYGPVVQRTTIIISPKRIYQSFSRHCNCALCLLLPTTDVVSMTKSQANKCRTTIRMSNEESGTSSASGSGLRRKAIPDPCGLP